MKLRPTRLFLALGLGLAVTLPAQSQSMGPVGSGGYGLGTMGGGMMGGGMMGGGMMGGGMMGGYGPRNEAPGQGNVPAPQWRELSSYVQSNGLPCMSCHAFTYRRTGPAYMDIARRFAGQPDGAAELAGAISNGVYGRWPGYPPMPGGLAKPGQARELARLILQLAP